MAISNLPDQKTPARPVEVTFAAETGTPSANQEVCLIGHAPSGFASSGLYLASTITNSGDLQAAEEEALAKYGECELTDMIVAAVKANQATGRFVQLKAIPLADTDTDFGPSDEALDTVDRIKAEFVVSPYSGQDSANRDLLKDACAAMSGPHRPSNNQFGTFGVVAEQDETDPSLLDMFDTQFLIGCWLPNTGTKEYTDGELAAACAAVMAGNGAPFDPLDDENVNGVPAPADEADWITVGLGLESESCLNQGWTPLRVKPTGDVAFVRTVTGRISPDGTGTPVVTAYYDVQDFQVLYFWRKTVYTRLSQPDFKQRKASRETAFEIKAELVRLATLFQDQQMFQAVSQLAKQFQVERASSDRHRFNVKTPVNVIPGLHVIATNVEATTEFDELAL